MENKCYQTKASSTFYIITNDTSYEVATNEIGIKPQRAFNKGDARIPKRKHKNSKIGYWDKGYWELKKFEETSDTFRISNHIKYFQDLLEDKIDRIEKLKHHYQFECVLRILVETEDAGESFELSEKELTFISKITNSFIVSIVAVDSN